MKEYLKTWEWINYYNEVSLILKWLYVSVNEHKRIRSDKTVIHKYFIYIYHTFLNSGSHIGIFTV